MKFFKRKYVYNFALLLFLILSIYYILDLAVRPEVKIDIDSNVISDMQIFYKIDSSGSYSEKYVYNKNIIFGNNKFAFHIPRYTNPLRMDFSNGPYNVTINDISLNYLFYSIPLDISKTQRYQIDTIKQDKSINITTIEGASDPQVFFTINTAQFEKKCFLAKSIITIFISIIIIFTYINFLKIRRMLANIEILLINFEEYVNRLNINFSKFYIYFLIGFVFHIFEISNFLLSPDDEYSAFRITPEAWIYDGRWMGFLIEKFIFDQPTIPFIPNIMSCILMAVAYIILLRAHNIQSSLRTYFIFPIFSAFPTLWTINEFYGNMVMVAFGFFIISVSVLLFVKSEESLPNSEFSVLKRVKILFYPSLLLAFSIASYQSFVMLGIAMILGILILKLKNNLIINIKNYLKSAFLYIAYGLILYGIINKFFKILYPSDYNYIDGFIKIDNIDFIAIMNFVYGEMLKVYTGSIEFFGTSISSLWMLVSIVLLSLILFNKNNRFLSIILLLSMLIAPFLLHFLSGGSLLPTRSMVALPYAIWLLAFLAIDNKNHTRDTIGIIVVGFLLIQQSSTLGQYAAATQIGQIHDRALAADLYKRISESNLNFNPNDEHILDIYGYKRVDTIYPKVPTSTMNASFFDWDGGNMSRIISFMNLIGYSNLKMANKELINKNTLYFNKMPSYPNKECVQYINGIYLIKLGDEPDVYRRK